MGAPGSQFSAYPTPVTDAVAHSRSDLRHYASMSETSEPSTPPPLAAAAPILAPAPQSERLYQAAAWVAIIAG